MAKDFQEKNCQILGISVDSQFTHKAWAETKKEEGGLGGELTYPLLADLNKDTCRNYGLLLGAGVALRGLFLINPDGIIMQATVNNLPVGRSTSEAMRILDAFQFVASHDGEVCPANWTTGADTMGASVEGMRKYISSH